MRRAWREEHYLCYAAEDWGSGVSWLAQSGLSSIKIGDKARTMISISHGSSAPSCLSKNIYANNTQASGNQKDMYAPGAVGERTVFSSLARQMISLIREQEWGKQWGFRRGAHWGEDTFGSFSAFVTHELSSVQPHKMGKNQDTSQSTMLPFEGAEWDLVLIFFSAPCFSLQRVTGKQRATNKRNKSYAALAEGAARSGPSHRICT